MKFLSASLETVLLRYYLMMAVVLAAFYLNIPWLAILAAPIFFSAILGIKIGGKEETPTTTNKEIRKEVLEQAA